MHGNMVILFGSVLSQVTGILREQTMFGERIAAHDVRS